MPSPFPGMDPFIESQSWQGFHTRFINALSDALVELLRPRYIVEVETYIFLEADDSPDLRIEPDVSLALAGEPARTEVGTALSALAQPITLTLPLSSPRRKQHYLSIRTRDHRHVVSIIELLSPTNKRPGEGHAEYQLKRENVLASDVNLVELDLLRDGLRLPALEPLPDEDYFAFVLRAGRLPKFEAYAWSLRDELPTIAIPLRAGETDALLDLQRVFSTVYDRAGYSYALDYTQDVHPPLAKDDTQWVREQLGTRSP